MLGEARAEQALAAPDPTLEGFLDSYALVELAVHLEAEFRIDLMNENMNEETFRSPTSLVSVIERLEADRA